MQKGSQKVDKAANHSSLFISMAWDMTWRLAIVVLVPIVGGFELDKALNTSPLLVILGFLLALAGTGLVMWQTLQISNEITSNPKGEKRS